MALRKTLRLSRVVLRFFFIKEEKSVDQAGNSIEWLGLLVVFIQMTFSLSWERTNRRVVHLGYLCWYDLIGEIAEIFGELWSTSPVYRSDDIEFFNSSLKEFPLKEFHRWSDNVSFLSGRNIESLWLDLTICSHACSISWGAEQKVFSQIAQQCPIRVDLFAASWNNQLGAFVSWRFQPGCVAVDAFSLSWRWMRAYLFSPFALIQRCLMKIKADKADSIMITPIWPAQILFPMLLELSYGIPRILPAHQRFLANRTGNCHPLVTNAALVTPRYFCSIFL